MARYTFQTTSPQPSGSNVRSKEERQRSQDRYKSVLEEKYPNILSAIQSMWGYKELNTYFGKLTVDDRGGREGFPPEVWEDLHLLLNLHQEIVPEPLFSNNQSRHALDFRNF